jgi:drug/metabolite transporter (DMT)-like permease
MTEQSRPLTPFILLASLSLFWGLNWPGMKIILSEMTVWWFRASCLVVGGTILLSVSALSGNRCLLYKNELLPIMGCGLFAILGWMVFSAYGVSLMPAGRASIIAFTMPLWATIFAAFILGEKITPSRITGLFIGVIGLGVLIGPDLIVLRQAPVGAVFMLCAALSWALGTVLIKRGNWQIPAISNVAWQLLFSSIPILLVAAVTEPLPEISKFSSQTLVALVYLFLFPMTFCQWAYFQTVRLLPASIAAIGTLLVPVIGVYSSHLILNEPVGLTELIALALIVTALVLVLLLPNIKSLGKTV